MFDRYNIVSEGDLADAAAKVAAYRQAKEQAGERAKPHRTDTNTDTVPGKEEQRPTLAGSPLSALFRIWCGEGDLNPHEIAPASTSS